MREDVACADSGMRFLPPEREAEAVHYTAMTLVEAFGEVRTVAEWAEFFGDGVVSLARRLNALAELPPEMVLEMPKNVRIREGVPLGGPRSWTWDVLPWEVDHWAQGFVDDHPSGATLEEVGRTLGVTREAIRQIEDRALRKCSRAAGRNGVRVRELLEEIREQRDRRMEVLP